MLDGGRQWAWRGDEEAVPRMDEQRSEERDTQKGSVRRLDPPS